MNDSSILEQQLETELLSRIARQDSEAFSCFYDRTCGILFAIAKSIVRDSFIAEDVLQEVYSSIWDKAEKFDPALGKPISWAIALTRNRALDKLRALKRREAGARSLEMSRPEWKSDADAFSESARGEIVRAVRQAIKKLDDNRREAIELAFLEGLPHSEVAEVMQQPLGTVKAWIRRGMLELRAEISEVFK